MRVLVTGGAGYIGSHTVRQLQLAGHDPIVFDNLSLGHMSMVRGAGCIVGDIADTPNLLAALRGVDAVVHFAALSSVANSVRDPLEYFSNNLQGGLTLLNAVVKAGTPYFILSSTCAVYGLPAQIPIPDDTPRLPINPYGATKLALEHALEAYGAAYGLRYVSLRYFNAAGADERGDIGEMHEPETHLIPLALETAAGLQPCLDIYGTDYPTPDGTCIRDYIHVNDLASAHIRAMEYLASGADSSAFNLGTGSGHSVLELLSAVERVTGHPVNRRHCPRRAGDPPVLVANAQRAMEALQWVPSRNLEDMVGTAWIWLQTKLSSGRGTAGKSSIVPGHLVATDR